MATLELRPSQERVRLEVAKAFREGHRRVLISSPCGWGKSELAASMLESTRVNGKRGIFVADRIALCDQASERLDKYDIPHGVFQGSGHPKYAPSANIQIGSVQTLVRRKTEPFQLHVYDEAHQLYAWSKRQIKEASGYHVGLSATGFVRGLGKYFDHFINGPTTNEMIEQGWLVPLKIYSCREPDMSEVPIGNNGEWEEKAAEKEVMQIVGDVVQNYLENGKGRKFICFASTIVHAKELQRQFISVGINAQTYTADDDGDDKRDIVYEFRKEESKINGLISVSALVRGFDVSNVELLILARPIRKSLADHIQILGRVMRIYPGKEFGTVFDHAGNCARFWWRTNRFFSHGLERLNKGEKEGTEKSAKEKQEKPDPDPIKCPQCGVLHKPMPICENCGFEFPKRSNVATVPGTLKELVATGNQRIMMDTLWPQVVDHVMSMKSAKGQNQDWIERKSKGIYYGIAHQWPTKSAAETTPIACTEAVTGKIKANQIKHSFSKKYR